MKTRILLQVLLIFILSVFTGQRLRAQDTIPRVIISEFSSTTIFRDYVELTNVGDTAVNLKDFELGNLVYWNLAYTDPGNNRHRMLPDFVLQPGESYLIAQINDWVDANLDLFHTRTSSTEFTPVDILANVDLPVFSSETASGGDPTDSISAQPYLMDSWNGRKGWWLEYHYPNGDSVICDAVKNDIQDNGMISNAPDDVAGVYHGTSDHHLVRKANVTRGTTDWDASRGSDTEDSQWILLPYQADWKNPRQRHFTTIKHHGVAEISSSTFSSGVIGIDFVNKKLTIPWGIYRDSLMYEFDLGKGLAWNLVLSSEPSDSVFNSVQANDTLIMWAVGNELQEIDFQIEISLGNDVNHVLPLNKISYVDKLGKPYYSRYRILGVTENQPGMDSITQVGFGYRADTLFKYLEKPSNASWEIVWVDGSERPDLKRGDILKVTAENGDIKEYYISADSVPEPSHDASLSAITWPDVPEYLMISPEWGGDEVIPNFKPSIHTYQMKVPYGSGNIPALNAIPANLNAKVTIKRATNLKGSVEDRTTVITVLAEDDSTAIDYSILFTQEVLATNVQPFNPDPIFSQFLFKGIYSMSVVEIFNPGNQDLDLSNYMLVYNGPWEASNPANAITGGDPGSWSYNAEDYTARFRRYVFGYDFVSPEEWASKPGYLVQDPSVDPILGPGEVFTFGYSKSSNAFQATAASHCDVLVKNTDYDFADLEPPLTAKVIEFGTGPEDDSLSAAIMDLPGGPWREPLHLFKILNNEILQGNKGITDPADFQLVDVFAGYSMTPYNINGENSTIYENATIEKKPEFYLGDTIPYYSFGNTPDSSQWIYGDQELYASQGMGWTNSMLKVCEGIGGHVMDPVTVYMSTVSSLKYLVSDGYESPQNIEGVDINTTVESFLENIIKADTAQGLKVVSGSSGGILDPNAEVSDQDTLWVISADSSNITKYALTVTDGGLDDNAVLVAKAGSGYEILIDDTTGTITGIPAGATIKEVLENIEKPATATLNVINEDNELVSLYTINFDSVKLETRASHLTLFEVVAQNNSTIITYQLVPDVDSSDAYLFSDMYVVDQDSKIVSGIPTGTRVPALFNYLLPNKGATMVLYDKAGNERVQGTVAYDDIVIVTSENGSVWTTYYLQFIEEPLGKLAYVQSDVLTIDQINFMITDVVEGTSVEDLTTMLEPAPGATMIVLDASGNETTTGEVLQGYQVKVTSQDNSVITTYDITIVVSVIKNRDLGNISVYPNPTSGIMFIVGLKDDYTVRVLDMSGRVLKVFKSENIQHGTISISDQPAGMYIISVTSKGYQLKTLKVLKR
jgi:hypothetical protein